MRFLEVQNMNAFYGDFQALYDVSMTVNKGQSVALIGPNGAGKSTLLRALAGWVPVAPESVSFKGQPIGGIAANKIVSKGIASVPEGRRLFPSLTVTENMEMGKESGREGVWNFDKVLDLFPMLKERKHHLGSELSGGQQQMVAIGRALLANPEILLFDELSLGLAPAVVNDIARTLPHILETGISMIVVEQNVKRALNLSNYSYCLIEGRIVLQGESEKIAFKDIENAFFGVGT